ncbi:MULTISPECIES: hypothetical protein [Alcaligenes]|jgi:DNA repair protein RadC|uniref:hypothetical protein n=1 Tax=Alcaligenes TaxID=507 RepID=UPI00375287EE
MTQYYLFLESLNTGALLVREADSAVRTASRKEILSVVRELVNVDEVHGQTLDNSATARDFLRMRLNSSR